MATYAPPIVLQANDVESKTGERLSLYSILLSTTSHLMNRARYEGSEAQCQRMVEAGVQAASRLGCESFSLGQYTSIVTRNGQRLNHLGMGVSTGNSYTVALAIEAVQQSLREQGRMPKFERLAVVGAAGNIGQTVAKMLAPQFESTTLIGSRRSRQQQRLGRLAESLANTKVGDSLDDISRASVIVMAVSASEQILDSNLLAQGAILCDISVPSVTAPQLADERPDVTLLKGGLAHLPQPVDLGIPSFPLPPGITFGCMAEGLILGFEKDHSTTFTGVVTREKVERIQQLAQKHGFGLAGTKDFSVLDAVIASGRG